ncbi:hypothetical protein K1T71_007825 [Dendrolimus kikuchii]|uniref:Uncharacterized protein n=1 Tax=Dendrolimus kikuchii TaxID=765133 RepID=A0ACC1CYJ9_9NEOP|nr:hypothetical protein K1T71_007825 [Dendrolimus kikuchii]
MTRSAATRRPRRCCLYFSFQPASFTTKQFLGRPRDTPIQLCLGISFNDATFNEIEKLIEAKSYV